MKSTSTVLAANLASGATVTLSYPSGTGVSSHLFWPNGHTVPGQPDGFWTMPDDGR
jgi:hypothetical protein